MKLIITPVCESLENSINHLLVYTVVSKLSISQCHGVITLIPKDDSDLLNLQNWRPITLLSTDSKTASKAIARRIETILKERDIGENLRLISDVLERL